MATNSGLYVANWLDILNGTQLAVDYTLANSVKLALYNSTGFSAANFSTEQYYNTTNELPTGGNYTQGGQALSGLSLTESPSGKVKFTASTVTWTNTTLSNISCGKLYFVNDASDSAFGSGAKPLIGLVYFGVAGPYNTVNGDFKVQWPTTGIFSINLTP